VENKVRRPKRLISKTILALLDFTLIAMSFYTGYIIRVHLPGVSQMNLPPALPIHLYSKYLFAFLIWLITFYYEGLYTKYLTRSEEFIKITKGTTISSAFAALLFYTLQVQPSFSRLAFFISYIISIFFLWFGRIIAKVLLYELKIYREKAVFWGNSIEIEWFRKIIEKEKNCGIEVAAHIKNYNLKELEKVVDEIKPSLIVVGGVPIEDIKKIEPLAWTYGIEILINAFNSTLNPQELEVVEFFGFKSLKLKYSLLIPQNVTIKRALDLIITIPLIILTIPLFVIIGIAVKLSSKGPVIYKSDRIGKDGRIFKIYKFRTMYMNSDEILKNFLKQNPVIADEYEKFRKIKSVYDPRVTPVGKFLRKTSLDELPQLFNVIKGEMSLVGPRPYLPEEYVIIEDVEDVILSVKPGLTGLWQVSGRNALSFEEKIMLELYYVKNWNIFLDIAILLKTIPEIFKGSGAY